MSTRVLRSSTKILKRTYSNSSETIVKREIIESGTAVKRQKTKKTISKAAPATSDAVNIPISYYKTLVLPEKLPQLPQSFKDAHEPKFIHGLEYLIQKDPIFYDYIMAAPFPSFAIDNGPKRPIDEQYYFESLVSGIISQQISGKAAKAIKQRLKDNLGEEKDRLPSFHVFATTPLEVLRSYGLSERKAQYIQAIAEDFDKKILNKQRLEAASDEEIYDILIAYKGIGPWSVVMFLLFCLKRLNVFTHADLGILRGASRYLLDKDELLSQLKANTILKGSKKKDFKNRKWKAVEEEYVATLSKEFEPYMSCLMLVLWRLSDIDIDALETAS